MRSIAQGASKMKALTLRKVESSCALLGFFVEFKILKHQPVLSIIITAFNEEKNVSLFLNRLKKFLKKYEIDHEVAFVDDGSTDNTATEAYKFSDWKNLRIMKLSNNLGSGGAIKEALKLATGEWYVWFPCDLEILPEELLLPFEKRHNRDVVVTYFESGLEVRSWPRRLMSTAFTGILNFAFGLKLPYYNGLTLIRRSFIKEAEVLSDGFFFHAELLVRTLAKTDKIAFMPIHLSPRNAGKPKAIKYRVFKDVASCFLRTLWEVRLRRECSHC